MLGFIATSQLPSSYAWRRDEQHAFQFSIDFGLNRWSFLIVGLPETILKDILNVGRSADPGFPNS
jgi:hypothetical protein